MNLPTSTEEIEAIFRKYWNDAESTKDIKPLYQLAHKSEYVNGCAAGVFETVARGISLRGIDPAPVFATILMGFRLGVLWQQDQHHGTPIPLVEAAPEPKVDEAMAAYLKYLEENPEPKKIEGEQN